MRENSSVIKSAPAVCNYSCHLEAAINTQLSVCFKRGASIFAQTDKTKGTNAPKLSSHGIRALRGSGSSVRKRFGLCRARNALHNQPLLPYGPEEGDGEGRSPSGNISPRAQ